MNNEIILNKLKELNKSTFRSSFHLKEKDKEYLKEKGFEEIKNHAKNFIALRLANANPKNDGKQTPMKGHPVFIAQHATATCCRNCMYKWHKIKPGVKLTDEQIDYVVNLIMTWIDRQMIEL